MLKNNCSGSVAESDQGSERVNWKYSGFFLIQKLSLFKSIIAFFHLLSFICVHKKYNNCSGSAAKSGSVAESDQGSEKDNWKYSGFFLIQKLSLFK